jgi:hypothetical protein
MNANRRWSDAPGFLDSIIIILVAAALVLFLLWATSRTQHITAFEQLPDWLKDSYHAVWTSAASGATGIGLAIVRVFTRKPEDPRPNYLLWIMVVTVFVLILIFFLPRVFAQPERKYVEAKVVSGGFKPWIPGSQLHGTECGQPTIVFSDANVDANVEEWKDVRWDASYICRRQGLGGTDGSIKWDTPNRDTSKVPIVAPEYGLWGTMTFRYFQPGHYTVSVDVSTSCLDINVPPNPCRSHGEFQVNVSAK